MSDASLAPVLPAAPLLTPVRETIALFTLLAVNVTHIVDFMIMMPLGPQLTRLLGISDAQFGLLVSAYALAAGISAVVATSYIDRMERKKLLLILYFAFALATYGCAVAPTYEWLMAARVLAGLFGGVLGALVQTIVADIVPLERRGRAMGVVMSSFALATVAGVPASLWLADRYEWHAPFVALALASLLVLGVAWACLPKVGHHLAAQADRRRLDNLIEVVRRPESWRGWGFSFLVILSSFTIIPYITIYTVANVGLAQADVPLVYLTGGLVTLASTRLWGVMTDRIGPAASFRFIALLSLVPMLILTHLPQVPLWGLLLVTSVFFIFVPGRMVPSMTLLSATIEPRLRGSFMTLNSATISAALGVGAFIGGLMISRNDKGLVMGYEMAGWLSVPLTLAAIWLVGRLKMVGRT